MEELNYCNQLRFCLNGQLCGESNMTSRHLDLESKYFFGALFGLWFHPPFPVIYFRYPPLLTQTLLLFIRLKCVCKNRFNYKFLKLDKSCMISIYLLRYTLSTYCLWFIVTISQAKQLYCFKEHQTTSTLNHPN